MNITFNRCRDTSDALMDAAMALYRASFPSHELRLWDDQKAVMSDPAYHFDMCLTDGALAGLILYWDFGSYIYVEHFCVEPNLRGQGLGTLILRALAQQNDKPIIIPEIDPRWMMLRFAVGTSCRTTTSTFIRRISAPTVGMS